MNRYLIFRSDRVGDYLLCAILIKSIKRNDPHSIIDVVGSKINFLYIKSFNNVDTVFKLKNGLLNKLNLFYKLNKNKYNVIINHDGKNRSALMSTLLRSKLKISNEKNLYKTQIDIILSILKNLNFDFNESDLNILENRNDQNNDLFKFDYSVLHFDEKWIYDLYIKNYINIQPTKDELINLINRIVNKTKMKLILTTGIKPPDLLNEIFSKNSISNVLFYKNINILELEEVIIKSKLLISCHGSVSHMASAKKIKQIDIIDENKLNPYSSWTKHFRNYSPIFRKKFNDLSNDIVNLL
tara:strand:+ start:4428 stop:5321 length:894 start_codon:yes stop_codon:yes gene_type:complete